MAELSNTAMRLISRTAAAQEGLVTTNQLRAVGLSGEAISRWVATGRLHPVLRTVFSLGHRTAGQRLRLRAVALACGAGTVVSHRSAAWLLGLREKNPAVVDVICPAQAGRKIDGIRVHNVAYPAPGEILHVLDIPCTNISRMVVDLAGVHGEVELREMIEMAAVRKVLDLSEIDAVLAQSPRRRGVPCLRRVLEDWRPMAETAKYATVRSLFEAKLLPLVAAAGLPTPEINAPARTAERVLEVDLLWPDHRFIVEADPRRFHAIEVAFERDHRRDRELMAVDYAVLRVTWREAEREPEAVLAVVRDELRRRAGWGTRPEA